jgi:hypothetical protein
MASDKVFSIPSYADPRIIPPLWTSSEKILTLMLTRFAVVRKLPR